MQTDFEAETTDEQLDPPPPKDTDGIPYCPDHHCRMKQKSGGKKGSPTRYYGCSVPGCKHKGQLIKTPRESVVPSQPVTCPRCDGAPVCSRDAKLSTGAYVILACPSCSWKSNALAVPQLEAQRLRHTVRRPAAEGVGDR